MSSREKVLVAMSGGVDSSFAALSLRDRGFKVFGLHFRLWGSGAEPEAHSLTEESARQTAQELGIEFRVLDLRRKFRDEVVSYFVNEYLSGRTPNPCALCNPRIKFQSLVELAEEIPAAFIATGHYARISSEAGNREYQLLSAKDRDKDQSYFLAFLPRAILRRVIFPLGEMKKNEVKKCSREMKLAAASRPESQDICFALAENYPAVIESLRPEAKRPGDIVDLSGKKIGSHRGIYHYTIGQRRGLGLNRENGYVIAIDAGRNQVVVDKESYLFHRKMQVASVNWLDDTSLPFECQVKIRHRSAKADARVEAAEQGKLLVSFAKPQRAITPGQAAVFYDGERVIAGAWIEKALD
jgi:tRNA-specific 2-thiouridylase